LPTGLGSGALPLVLTVGTAAAPRVTVWLQ
jgi:hypothetical protein